jgi:hypothetical protein
MAPVPEGVKRAWREQTRGAYRANGSSIAHLRISRWRAISVLMKQAA